MCLYVLLLFCTRVCNSNLGCVVWDPRRNKGIVDIENIHTFALRACFKQWRASYGSLLCTFNSYSMSERRAQLKLYTQSLFNILNCNMQHVFSLSIHIPCTVLQIHLILHQISKQTPTISVLLAHTNSFKYFFFPLILSVHLEAIFNQNGISGKNQ